MARITAPTLKTTRSRPAGRAPGRARVRRNPTRALDILNDLELVPESLVHDMKQILVPFLADLKQLRRLADLSIPEREKPETHDAYFGLVMEMLEVFQAANAMVDVLLIPTDPEATSPAWIADLVRDHMSALLTREMRASASREKAAPWGRLQFDGVDPWIDRARAADSPGAVLEAMQLLLLKTSRMMSDYFKVYASTWQELLADVYARRLADPAVLATLQAAHNAGKSRATPTRFDAIDTMYETGEEFAQYRQRQPFPSERRSGAMQQAFDRGQEGFSLFPGDRE